MSADNLKVRGKVQPTKWPLQGPVGMTVTSNLHADVPEFVPGKAYAFHPDDSGISHDAGKWQDSFLLNGCMEQSMLSMRLENNFCYVENSVVFVKVS